jgi:hypothetical protein
LRRIDGADARIERGALTHSPGSRSNLLSRRRLYFNKGKHRVIYQLLANDKQPKTVPILAVGRRANLGVYREAARRLGRTPGIDAPDK